NSLIYDERDRISGYLPSRSAKDYNLLYIDQNECTRCGACAEVCPVECIPLQRVSRVQVPENKN
ncbi:MAG: 4Fe-4S dicluster domain-containing protein, partial [Gammaproteobacteria bacterium]|nr:4Fe-4S dicluster domain-containing protein [Gammaproteobacteria bacterium]